MRLELKRAIGTCVKAYRLKKNIPQESLGPSQPYISNLEAGRGSASIDKIEQMADILGIHPMSIIFAGYLTSNEDVTKEDLFDRIRKELAEIGF
ncbi:helix-turn-helix domain-containing protein [Pseudomonas arsenicoxydans]|uniref:helix-turn-helix domain-containing protein n=1 Tax=Pseudomonas arsenicoxydans TaxID=702115 RepID=UPI000B7E2E13|nr:helix-turn-helix transcriptional regulator [Pseudomonas arsenicoxydans]